MQLPAQAKFLLSYASDFMCVAVNLLVCLFLTVVKYVHGRNFYFQFPFKAQHIEPPFLMHMLPRRIVSR